MGDRRVPLPVVVPLAVAGTIIGGAGLALLITIRIINDALGRNS